MRTTRGLKAVMDANGGEIPNKLYLEKNERLSKMIEDFTDVQPPADATTKDLVNQILDIIKNTKVEPNTLLVSNGKLMMHRQQRRKAKLTLPPPVPAAPQAQPHHQQQPQLRMLLHSLRKPRSHRSPGGFWKNWTP